VPRSRKSGYAGATWAARPSPLAVFGGEVGFL
jgi:hypothetical protein